MAKTVSITVGGAAYRVKATAPEGELRRLAALVDEKLRELDPTLDLEHHPVSPQVFVLVALAHAHDLDELRQQGERLRAQLEDERTRRLEAEATTRDFLRRMINRIEAVLDEETRPDDPLASLEHALAERDLAVARHARPDADRDASILVSHPFLTIETAASPDASRSSGLDPAGSTTSTAPAQPIEPTRGRGPDR